MEASVKRFFFQTHAADFFSFARPLFLQFFLKASLLLQMVQLSSACSDPRFHQTTLPEELSSASDESSALDVSEAVLDG